MFAHRIKLFTVFDIDIKVDASWLLLAVLVAWTLASGVFPQLVPDLTPAAYWRMAILGAAGLFASIIFHEMAHALVARRYGIAIRGITLFIFGGVAEMEAEPKSPRGELLMALAGPAASLLLAAVLEALTTLAGDKASPAVTGVLWYLALINGLLGLFNLLPAFPLDGGRVLRAALWAWRGDMLWASRIAAAAGDFFGILLIVLGVVDILRGDFVGGMWRFLIGMFLRGAATASYGQTLAQRAFDGTTVAALMTADPIGVPPEISIAEFIESYVYRYHHRVFPVTRHGALLGQVGTRQAATVDRALWPKTTVAEIMLPVAADDVVAPELDALAALSRMQRTGRGRFFVVEDGALRGVLTLRDLLEVLSTRLELDAPVDRSGASWPEAGYPHWRESAKS